jgi:hypothetical protein
MRSRTGTGRPVGCLTTRSSAHTQPRTPPACRPRQAPGHLAMLAHQLALRPHARLDGQRLAIARLNLGHSSAPPTSKEPPARLRFDQALTHPLQHRQEVLLINQVVSHPSLPTACLPGLCLAERWLARADIEASQVGRTTTSAAATPSRSAYPRSRRPTGSRSAGSPGPRPRSWVRRSHPQPAPAHP